MLSQIEVGHVQTVLDSNIQRTNLSVVEPSRKKQRDFTSMMINLPSTSLNIVDKKPQVKRKTFNSSPEQHLSSNSLPRKFFQSRLDNSSKQQQARSNIYLPNYISEAKVRQLSMQEQLDLFKEGDKK